MSLKTQLWIAVAVLMLLSLLVSVAVSTVSARNYLMQQLHLKNVDNAASLALSLTQLPKDEATVELALAAQFDTGHYRLIRLTNPRGEVMQERSNLIEPQGVPQWFVRLMAFEIDPGIAHISAGWTQFGVLTVESQTTYAYESLWHGTRNLALIFAAGAIFIGLLGSLLLSRTVKPLDDVVDQAEAIGERRFITIDEPYTLEFRRVVAAMNLLSERIKGVLQQEAKRLEKWQREAHVDKVTGLLNREPFMQSLDTALSSDDVNATGTLALIRVQNLGELNKKYGRKIIDGLLKDVGQAFSEITRQHSRWGASRLNGSDFAVLAPRAIEPELVAREAQERLRVLFESRSFAEETALPSSATVYAHGDTIGSVMTRLDSALQNAEKHGRYDLRIAYANDVQMMPVREQLKHWQEIFDAAFKNNYFSLAAFPAVDLEGNLIHLESPVRLAWEGEVFAAGKFLPWINRLEISYQLDKQVIKLALSKIVQNAHPICINLSVGAVVESGFPSWLGIQLAGDPVAAKNLWLEIPEAMAFRHLNSFKQLCREAKAHGSKVGIKRVGHQLADIGELHDIGLDFLKADAGFIRDLAENPANQTLLRTLCTVGHSIGVKVIAEGVRTEEEWLALGELGIDGVTGPGVTNFKIVNPPSDN